MGSRIFSPPRNDGNPPSSPAAPERFSLTGPSHPYDARFTAARRDLADVALADRIFSPHYARALPTVAAQDTPIFAASGDDAECLGILQEGNGFRVLELTDRLAWGQVGADGLVGYVDRHQLLAE